MKNKESMRKRLLRLFVGCCNFGVNKYTGKPVSCNDLYCNKCLLNEMNSRNCHNSRHEWAESEYVEHSVISKSDKAFLEYLREEYKYIARDKNDILCVCESAYWYWGDGSYFRLNPHFDIDFPMVKWSDEKPWLIEDLKRLEVVDEYENQ